MCSTPFGIGDRCGFHLMDRHSQFINVLNAFRHRRSVRTGAVTIPLFTLSAQRLSASEIGAGRACADIQWPANVLNAFRHRRSVRAELVPIFNGLPTCSTPFGIGDRCGPCQIHDCSV
ncbi:uncharacterized protein Dmul_04190 [Desulfococcus multivorans]|nr:uncharacterized protein Dmul_04190 [Desulfococcus multivorans]